MNNILLVDGNLLLFKSYYSVVFNNSEYKNSKGLDNRTIHRFFFSLINTINEFNISHILVAFDAHGKTKKSEKFPEYKQGRTRPDPIIYEYKKYIIELLDLVDIKHLEIIGDEADDIIASARKSIDQENNFFILSDDHDLLQLVSKNTSIIYKDQKTKKLSLKNWKNFRYFYDFEPRQIVDFKAISGDSSDNIKGIDGIGKVTATKLIQKFDSLENIYQNLESLSPKIKEKFQNSKEEVFLFKEIVTINEDIKLNFDLDMLKKFDFLNAQAIEKLDFLELKKIKNMFLSFDKKGII